MPLQCWQVYAVQCTPKVEQIATDFQSRFTLIPADTFRFNNFVDCNMAEAWVGDTFRIFPGKYGEDPVWGYSRELKFASGPDPDHAFSSLGVDLYRAKDASQCADW
ncbi:MAG: hypothetical protein U5K79_15325 [Cyclobacteriaceae bacterium]|nr:hypothetical protein [Cyclobacteriaceae bacterium]